MEKKILKIAPDYDFINTKIDINFIPPQNAIFTTRSDRNLQFLIQSWFKIKIDSTKAQLHINPPYVLNNIEKEKNIILRTKGDKNC